MSLANQFRPYPLDNAHTLAARHHQALSALLDPITINRIHGLVSLAGKRCLEVGAGAGSIAHFLAEEVGERGTVTALDINPIHIQPHPRLSIAEHDLTVDPIDGSYDFIHARLVLSHLPERGPILYRLIQALAPGGYLLIEDWYIPDRTIDDMVIAAPSPVPCQNSSHRG